MAATDKIISPQAGPRAHPLKANADTPPDWQHSMFRGIPFIGPVWNVLGNGMRYNIKLEDCAEFIASHLEENDKFVGKRVGLIEAVKGKDD